MPLLPRGGAVGERIVYRFYRLRGNRYRPLPSRASESGSRPKAPETRGSGTNQTHQRYLLMFPMDQNVIRALNPARRLVPQARGGRLQLAAAMKLEQDDRIRRARLDTSPQA